MARKVAAALLVLFFATALGAPASAQTTKQVVVSAKRLWAKTGIVLHAGDPVTISATGSWTWNRVYNVGPDGDPTDDYNAFDLFEPFDFYSQARLIAYIGPKPKQDNWGNPGFFPQTSGYISIGLGQTFIAPYDGELWLGFNDAAVTKSARDNEGSVTANITVGSADTTAPAVSIASPAGVYVQNQSVNASFSCTDPDNGVASCTGAVDNGQPINTLTPGAYSFTAVGTDNNGNAASQHSSYVVVDTNSSAVLPVGGTFLPTYIGTRSAIQAFYLSNPQTFPITISNVSVSDDFVITGTQCSGTLNPRHTCKISVAFNPTYEGSHRSEIDVAASVAIVPVPLYGIGTLARVTPAGFSFGDQQVGVTSAPKNFILSNNEPQFLFVEQIVASGDFAIAPSTTCHLRGKLASGKSCTIAVNFTPSVTGARTGSLIVHAIGTVAPTSVSLNGNGTPP